MLSNVSCSGLPAAQRDADRPDGTDQDLLGARLAELGARHGVLGAQLAVLHGERLRHAQFGVQDHATRRDLGRDDKVPVGSITKALTATLAMILVSDGDLDLDQPVNGPLPELGHGLGDQLTLRHLLGHTGGLAGELDEQFALTLSARRYVAECCERLPLVDQPGRSFSYSTAGYVLVGRLIEAATGMSWWEAVDTILLRPLGIDPVFIAGPTAARPTAPIVTGHSVNLVTGSVRAVDQVLAPAEAAAGALALSALDLVAFGRLHLADTDGELLSAAVAKEMREPVERARPFGLADGWGLGFALFRQGGTEWLGHDGTSDGTWCHLRINPAAGTVVALTTNSTTGLALWEALVSELPELGLPAGRYTEPPGRGRAIPLPVECVGRYLNGDTEYTVVAEPGGPPRLVVDGNPIAELAVHDCLTFTLTELGTGQRIPAGRFLRDQFTARITGMQISGRLARRQ